MYYAFSTLGCPDWTFEKVMDEAQKMGYDALEIRGINGVMRADEIPEFTPEKAQDTLAVLKAHGLSLVGFGSSCKFDNPDNYDAAIAEGKATIEVCRRMGIPYIRVFGDRIENEAARAGVISRVISGLTELCRAAEGTGVKILLEIHGNCNTIDVISEILAAVKDLPAFGILWDVAHSDRSYGDGWRPFYELIRPYICHIHIKDHKRLENEQKLCLVGEGDIPIPEVVATLLKDGYDGCFSLEWEKKWHPDLPDASVSFPGYLSYMKKL